MIATLVACQAYAKVGRHTKVSNAAKMSCEQVTKELQEMQRAQAILLSSMVKKNGSMADTLDHFADDFSHRGQTLKKGDIVTLRKSAEAFRGHGDREAALIGKFEKASNNLIEKATLCLAQNEKNQAPPRSEQLVGSAIVNK